MKNFICTTCGTQYPLSKHPPSKCTICNEERQYVNPNGQCWTTLNEMIESKKFHNEILFEENGLYSITTKPEFGIGQTAYFVQQNGFGLIWDCVAYLDEQTLTSLAKLGKCNGSLPPSLLFNAGRMGGKVKHPDLYS